MHITAASLQLLLQNPDIQEFFENLSCNFPPSPPILNRNVGPDIYLIQK